MTGAFSNLKTVAHRLGGEVNGGQVLAPGPGHRAKDRSLSVKLDASAPDGFVVHSFSGDDPAVCRDHVRDRLNLPTFKLNGDGRLRRSSEDVERLLQQAVAREATPSKLNIVAQYDYTDADGTLLYQVLRLQPKDFRQRRPDGNGGWAWGLRGVKRVPYRLPDLVKYESATTFLTEGEKDCERLRTLSLCATTLSGGSKWTPEIAEYFRGRNVIVVPDHDGAGREKAWQAASALHNVAASVRVVTLPDLSGQPGDKDVSDWLDTDASRAATFVDICLATPLWTPQPAPKPDEPTDGDGDLLGWDAGDDDQMPPPRGWLLGNSFCRSFVSSLLADGGVGKTALRYPQMLSLATGRALTGEHVFQRCRVLIVTLEDGRNELRRRLRAARLHHKVELRDIKGWLFIDALGRADGKLMMLDQHGRPVLGVLAAKLERTIAERKIDIVMLDPFIKSHGIPENDNRGIDEVAQILTDLSVKFDIAVDVPHHMSKGPPDPGNANRGRGASSLKDAFRVVDTATPMSPDEAKSFGISEAERRSLIRIDRAKVNIAPMTDARWFKLVSVNIGNGTEMYPSGDNVQTVEPWTPPGLFTDVSIPVINQILDEIEAGLSDGIRYSDARNVADERAAWSVVKKHTGKGKGPAGLIVKTWRDSGLLIAKDYYNSRTRKDVSGLWVDNLKRPT